MTLSLQAEPGPAAAGTGELALRHPLIPPRPVDLPALASPAARESQDLQRDFEVPDAATRVRLFAAFQPLVRRLIHQYGEDPESRQDLVGEIYCRFCTLLDAYDPQRGVPVRAYLARTLPASIYTYSRSQWRHRDREVPLDPGSSAESLLEADPAPAIGRQVAAEAVLAALPNAIAALPVRQRQVLIWRYYEGLSFDEIAAQLGIRPATARSLLRHGINNLRRTIGVRYAEFA